MGRTKTRAQLEALRGEAVARAAAGEPLGPCEMAAIYRLCTSTFSVLNTKGFFDHLKLRPAIGRRCFSGVLVHRHISGEAVYEPTFGRKRVKSA